MEKEKEVSDNEKKELLNEYLKDKDLSEILSKFDS